MNELVYEKIVKNIILPLSNDILSSQNNRMYHAIKLRKEFNNKLFNIINKFIFYLKSNVVSTIEIDEHKISACLMCAIVDYRPFIIMKKGYYFENLFYANELLGIYSVFSLLECYNPDLKIELPKTIHIQNKCNDVDSYILSLCVSLYISKNNRQLKYSILNYSNILFLLESLSL